MKRDNWSRTEIKYGLNKIAELLIEWLKLLWLPLITPRERGLSTLCVATRILDPKIDEYMRMSFILSHIYLYYILFII